MATNSYTSSEKIQEIFSLSSRLRYLLNQHYSIKSQDIRCVVIDGDNVKLDIETPNKRLRFKAKGPQNVLLPNPQNGQLVMTVDPALAQALYEIASDFGR